MFSNECDRPEGLGGGGSGAEPKGQGAGAVSREQRQGGELGNQEGGLGESHAQRALSSQPHRAWGTTDTC